MHTKEICGLLKQYSAHKEVNCLDLSNNRITDEGIVSICKALANSQIHTVKVAKNKLTDKCCEPLALALKTNRNLRLLVLAENNI